MSKIKLEIADLVFAAEFQFLTRIKNRNKALAIFRNADQISVVVVHYISVDERRSVEFNGTLARSENRLALVVILKRRRRGFDRKPVESVADVPARI